MLVQAKGQVRPEKSAYHSIALLTESFEKDISLLLPRACSTMDKIVDRCALTIYPYSLNEAAPAAEKAKKQCITPVGVQSRALTTKRSVP